jgi:hypothetical protein
MAWHTRFFTGLVLDPLAGKGIDPGIWEWMLWIMSSAVAMTWLFNNARGSVLAAVLFHTAMNGGAVVFWCCKAPWHWPAVLAAAPVALVAIYGARDMVRRRALPR